MAKRPTRRANSPRRRTGGQRLAGATGASDASSGGGAGSGIPDADMQMRTGGRASRGDVQRDREKLFPETKGRKPPGRGERKR